MSDGKHLIILPIVYAVVVPFSVLLIGIFQMGDFFYNLLIAFGSILVFWNLLEYYLIFNNRRGNYKKFSNAFKSKKIIKMLFIIAVALVASEISVEYKEYGKILSKENFDQHDDAARIHFEYKSSFLLLIGYAVFPLIIPITFPKYYFGKSYGYFQIGLNKTEKIHKIWAYQNALESYSHYLAETLGVKFKHLDEIESKIIVGEVSSVDKKINNICSSTDNEFNIAIELNRWIEVDEKDIFKQNSFLENSEKWSKFLPAIATGIGIAVAVYLHYSPIK